MHQVHHWLSVATAGFDEQKFTFHLRCMFRSPYSSADPPERLRVFLVGANIGGAGGHLTAAGVERRRILPAFPRRWRIIAYNRVRVRLEFMASPWVV